MSIDTEKDKQAEVEKDIKNCTHIGYFVGFGFETIPVAGGLLCISAIVCMMCGANFNPQHLIKNVTTLPMDLDPFRKNPFGGKT